MAELQRIHATNIDGVIVVEFKDRRIVDELIIRDLGDELLSLLDEDGPNKILLNFSHVEFLSSAALGKLISLRKRAVAYGGEVKLSNICDSVYTIFELTGLTKPEKFDIKTDQDEALRAFA
ncbi:MAG: STAS domain-containing protein [Pirellulaceae bacterium]|nr:STAS domain-containing protein [Planctomycetales bacterium]